MTPSISSPRPCASGRHLSEGAGPEARDGVDDARALADLIAGLPTDLHLRAVTHSSWTADRADSYGRLAFLGDAVLGLAVAEHLFRELGRADIGPLTKLHGQAVSGRACKEVALALGLPRLLGEAEPEVLEGGISAAELLESERAMSSITESVIGACYLHFGFEQTAAAVTEAFAPQLELAAGTVLDFKSALQEELARSSRLVAYRVTAESGPPHDRTFEVEAVVGDEVLGTGNGRSKKAAEQAAAAAVLERLGSSA